MSVSLCQRVLGIAALLSVASATFVAHAEPQGQENVNDDFADVPSNQTPTKEWYGAPMILTDLAAFGLIGAAIANKAHHLVPALNVGSVAMYTGLAAYVLGGPIVHFAENQTSRGFASLGLRVVAPIGGMVAGGGIGAVTYLATTTCQKEEEGLCLLEGFAYGGVVGLAGGLLTAAVVDNVLLAKKPTVNKQFAFAVSPTYEPKTGQAGLALRGTW
jgi:hypothetical protein